MLNKWKRALVAAILSGVFAFLGYLSLDVTWLERLAILAYPGFLVAALVTGELHGGPNLEPLMNAVNFVIYLALFYFCLGFVRDKPESQQGPRY